MNKQRIAAQAVDLYQAIVAELTSRGINAATVTVSQVVNLAASLAVADELNTGVTTYKGEV